MLEYLVILLATVHVDWPKYANFQGKGNLSTHSVHDMSCQQFGIGDLTETTCYLIFGYIRHRGLKLVIYIRRRILAPELTFKYSCATTGRIIFPEATNIRPPLKYSNFKPFL
jgi:hypothetical protein